MNMKLFGKGASDADLQGLYRAAEDGEQVPSDMDPALQAAFAADEQLIQQLGRLADRSGPAHPAIGRATLLTQVARKKSCARDEERTPMIGRLLTGRALALLATAGIFAGGAVTVGASGGVSGAAGNVNDVLAALHVTDRTPNQADAHLDNIDQPDGSGKPDAASATPGGGRSNAGQRADDNAGHGLQNATEAAGNAGQGIQNAAPRGLDHANGHATDGPSSDASATPGVTPVTRPGQAGEHASEGAGESTPPLPPRTTPRASEGREHGPGQ